MTKKEKQIILNQYLNRYIDPVKQYQDLPITVFNGWIRWLFEMWDNGLISIKEYRTLIKIELKDYENFVETTVSKPSSDFGKIILSICACAKSSLVSGVSANRNHLSTSSPYHH